VRKRPCRRFFVAGLLASLTTVIAGSAVWSAPRLGGNLAQLPPTCATSISAPAPPAVSTTVSSLVSTVQTTVPPLPPITTTSITTLGAVSLPSTIVPSTTVPQPCQPLPTVYCVGGNTTVVPSSPRSCVAVPPGEPTVPVTPTATVLGVHFARDEARGLGLQGWLLVALGGLMVAVVVAGARHRGRRTAE
jgi:hypothetical protein